MKLQTVKYERLMKILLHVICWGIFLAFPLMFIDRSNIHFSWVNYLKHSMVMLAFMVVFYINYFILIPRYLFRKQAPYKYIIYNLILAGITVVLLHIGQEMITPPPVSPEHFNSGRPRPPKWTFYVRDSLGMLFTIGISAVIRIIQRWSEIENARREAEKSRTEAELKNLRNQLNPHFILNTLNNIYALTAFDTEKARQAIQELSKLLRYMLYDNQEDYISLGKEIDFIQNYIELMRIRLSANVQLDTDIRIKPDNPTRITPLIFISLIENAFKHGISPTEPSYIRIALSEINGEVTCEIHNSNYPKSIQDKSGSGIGLPQVQKRLDLLYQGRYIWKKGVSGNGKEYFSKLVIKAENY